MCECLYAALPQLCGVAAVMRLCRSYAALPQAALPLYTYGSADHLGMGWRCRFRRRVRRGMDRGGVDAQSCAKLGTARAEGQGVEAGCGRRGGRKETGWWLAALLLTKLKPSSGLARPVHRKSVRRHQEVAVVVAAVVERHQEVAVVVAAVVERAEKGAGKPQAEVGRVVVVERVDKGAGSTQAKVGRVVVVERADQGAGHPQAKVGRVVVVEWAEGAGHPQAKVGRVVVAWADKGAGPPQAKVGRLVVMVVQAVDWWWVPSARVAVWWLHRTRGHIFLGISMPILFM